MYFILGAGVSGLALAYHLLETYPHEKVHIFEKLDRIGGRLQTYRTKEGVLLNTGGHYYAGSHTRLKHWIHRFKLRSKVKPPFEYLPSKYDRITLPKKYTAKKLYKMTPLQVFHSSKNLNTFLWQHPYQKDWTHSNAWSFFYSLRDFRGKKYQLLPSYESLCQKMYQTLRKDYPRRFQLSKNTKITNIHWSSKKKEWTVKSATKEWKGGKGLISTGTLPQWLEVSILRGSEKRRLRRVLGMSTLFRIYVKMKPHSFFTEGKHVITDTPFSQMETIDSEKGMVEISYSSDRIAHQWNRFLQNGILKEQLEKKWKKYFPMEEAIEIEDIYPFYWKRAVHYWKPGCNPKEEMDYWSQPYKSIPYFCANEGLSLHQGWVEGSFESVEKAWEKIKLYLKIENGI